MTLEGWHGGEVVAQGAEAVLERGEYLGRPALLKLRRPKGYRHPDLEMAIRVARVRAEARALREAREAGVRTPAVLDLDDEGGVMVLEHVEGPTVRASYDSMEEGRRHGTARALGAAVGRLHAAGLVHGDPTTSNFIVEAVEDDGGVLLAVLDMSMGGRAEGVEERGVDLRLLFEAFSSTHHGHDGEFELVLEGYRQAFPEGANEAIARMEAIAHRGRYRARGAAAGAREGEG